MIATRITIRQWLEWHIELGGLALEFIKCSYSHRSCFNLRVSVPFLSFSQTTSNGFVKKYSVSSLNSNMSYSSLPEIEGSDLKAKIEKLTIQADEWAECTAEWQQKWEKMRAKKEKAAKEALMYREKVDSMTRQLFMWKEKYLQLEKENDRLKTQLKVLSPDGMLLLSKSPSPNEVNLRKVRMGRPIGNTVCSGC